MAHYLVTGGAGFIGSTIVDELRRRKKKVSVLDNYLTGQRENLDDARDKITIFEADIRNLESIRALRDSSARPAIVPALGGRPHHLERRER